MTTRDERLQVMLELQELKALDDFRFKARMPSRAAAVRELIRRGLTAEGFPLASPGKPSSSFGIIDGGDSSGKPDGQS
jgi:hypothetical protein